MEPPRNIRFTPPEPDEARGFIDRACWAGRERARRWCATSLDTARVALHLSVGQLWLDYLALGGTLMPDDVQAFLSGHQRVIDNDHDLLAHALNERFVDAGGDHPVPYADERDLPAP